ncbi:uncharacterized protein BHQ10_008464 [Talaromyces amestolkiae]|uniref:Uncharacterized protein n=1 Tax=Talaromyces amestolkiae TaxID=1196081 RepID=A0A364L9G1_TALAM|nr:uncharacterized protein BHQ10_008464 [Talaromyces amestolkiae]RAO72452.1 hypothetical protein BHQ10_008464 [Talaromyces amestolkiae]
MESSTFNSNPNLHRTTTSNTTETDIDSTSLYSEHAALLFPSKDGTQPGFAPEQSLSRGLQIPSKTSRLTSGFEYPSVLGSNYNITKEEWETFTHEITESAKLSSSQWSTVIGAGLGVMAVGGMMLGFFGAIPAVMVARRRRATQESKNLARAMGYPPQATEDRKQAEEEEIGEKETALSLKISEWNEKFFQPRGIMIRIDMPYDISAVEDGIDVTTTGTTTTSGGKKKSSLRFPSPVSSRQGSVSSSASIADDKSERAKKRYEASQRCRIVIIPINQRPDSLISQATTLAGESPYIPAVYE